MNVDLWDWDLDCGGGLLVEEEEEDMVLERVGAE